MTVSQLFSMSAEEIKANFQDAVQCIRDNRDNKSGGLPTVWHNNAEMSWEMTAIVKKSAHPGFEVNTDGSITYTGVVTSVQNLPESKCVG